VVLKVRAHLHPAQDPRGTSVTEVLSPSLRARIRVFGSAAAMNWVSPREDGLFSCEEEKRPDHVFSLSKKGNPRGG